MTADELEGLENAAGLNFNKMFELRLALFNHRHDFIRLIRAAEEVNRLTDELLSSVECDELDIGGMRGADEVLGELGPAQETLDEALAPFRE